MALPSNVLAQALQMSQGQALNGPAAAPAGPKRMDDPDFLAALLSTFDDENSLLAQQLKRAQEAQQAGPRYSTPLATAIGGLGGVLRNVKGAFDEADLTRQMQGVQGRRTEAVQKAGQGPSASLLRAKGAAKPQLSNDPNSPESRRAQANFASLQPGRFTPEQLSQFSEADIIDRFQLPKYGTMATSQEIQREGIEAANRRNADRLGQTRELFYQRLGLDREKMNQDDRQFYDGLADKALERETSRAARKEEAVAGATERLGKEVVDAGAPGFYNRYDEAQGLLKKYPKDIPGIGRVDGNLPPESISEDGRQMRFLIGQMLSDYRKGQTGAGMSDAERQEYGVITGLLGSGAEAGVRQGMDLLKRAMDSRVQATGAGFRPEAVENLSQRSPRIGEALRQPKKAAPKPPAAAAPGLPPGKARVRLKAGGTLLIDAADLAEALRDPEVAGEVK